MSITRFVDLLQSTMGLNAVSIGISAVERALDARMRAGGIGSADDYWRLLQNSREELQELIEAVVVPETWFFRDPPAFAAMAETATHLWRQGRNRPLRLLSLPCSTGEEPYTMAMALFDAGLPMGSFRIDAIDISIHSLTKARRGIYGRNSFRGGDLTFRNRYFEPAESGFRICHSVRAPVNFRQGNLLDHGVLSEAEPYDVVFCRNLLIYFDAPTQSRAIAVLKHLLMPDGMLLVGHSEAGLMAANGFVSAKIPMAFAFRKASLKPITQAAPAPVASMPRKHPLSARTSPRRPVRVPRPAAPIRTEPSDRSASIEELRRIADSGRLDEAANGVETHIQQNGPSAEALLLLGLISDAQGDVAAALGHYRKALYLEPANQEALSHLALLLKNQGDHSGARLIVDRMRRSGERGLP